MPTETVDGLLELLKQLKIKENHILTELYLAREREQEGSSDNGPWYKQGDRVRIINTVKVFFSRRTNAGDRESTVLYTQSKDGENKIFLITDNGFKTWRLEKNIQKISKTDKQE
jgi:hypothetical protein